MIGNCFLVIFTNSQLLSKFIHLILSLSQSRAGVGRRTVCVWGGGGSKDETIQLESYHSPFSTFPSLSLIHSLSLSHWHTHPYRVTLKGKGEISFEITFCSFFLIIVAALVNVVALATRTDQLKKTRPYIGTALYTFNNDVITPHIGIGFLYELT